ncbi:MAG: hypothetical protein AB7N91_19090 [Candidatus Tectimicrobiota bacterium]
MDFGVSYFGVRNPVHFQRDLDAIAALGFTYIVFTFSEEDHRFYQGSLREFIQHTHRQGLKAYVDPWGVCGVFGGEAFTERGAWDLEGQQQRSDGRPLPLLCPNAPALRTYLQRWITTVAEVLQADAIFWDEPHFYLPLGEARSQGLWSCCCVHCATQFRARYGESLPSTETPEVRQCKHEALAALITEVTAMAASHQLKNIVCILPEHDDLAALQNKCDLFAANPHLDVLATDPYPLWYRREVASSQLFCDALLQACTRHRKAAQMWIQGFRVRAGEEPLLGDEMRLIARSGIRDIAIWSYLGTGYMSSHTCADAPRVWQVFTETMRHLL